MGQTFDRKLTSRFATNQTPPSRLALLSELSGLEEWSKVRVLGWYDTRSTSPLPVRTPLS